MQDSDRNSLDNNRFNRDFLNNKLVIILLNILLILLIIFMCTQISYLFQPLFTILNLFSLPIFGAGVLYYIFSPIVNRLSDKGMNRHLTIWIIFIIIIFLLIWGGSTLIPILRIQTLAFIDRLPEYGEQFQDGLSKLPIDFEKVIFSDTITKFFDNVDWNSTADQGKEVIASTFGGLGSAIGTVAQFVVGIITLPIVLYYLLLEGDQLGNLILRYVPLKIKSNVRNILYQSNNQLSKYIRGVVVVAVFVGIIFWIGYSFIGLEYAFTLAFIAAIFNVIPYLGSIISTIPALIIALLSSPFMIIKVIIVLIVEQLIESRLIQPLVLGNTLNIHPLVILFLILGSGRLFGVTGVILAIPVYAIVKVIVSEVYRSLHIQTKQKDE